MKVAVVSAAALPSPAPSYGGLESIAAYVAEELSEQHEVTMFAAQGSRTTKATLFETVPPQYEPSRDWPVEGAAWKRMEPELPKFDVVIDMSHAFHAYRHKLAHPEARVVKVVHDQLPSRTSPPPGSYDVLAGVSKFHAKLLEHYWGVPVTHLYNGIPTEQLHFSNRKDGYLLFLSRLDPGKGAHVFLNLVDKLGRPPAILAGDDDLRHGIDPHYRRAVLYRCVELGVDYRGQVTDAEKKELLAHARAVVVPLADPYREVFGIWIVEALASGTPVFTTAKGACEELMTRMSGAVAVNEDYLLEGLRRFLAGEFEFDPQTCREQARKFDISASGRAYEAVVRSLGEKPSPHT